MTRTLNRKFSCLKPGFSISQLMPQPQAVGSLGQRVVSHAQSLCQLLHPFELRAAARFRPNARRAGAAGLAARQQSLVVPPLAIPRAIAARLGGDAAPQSGDVLIEVAALILEHDEGVLAAESSRRGPWRKGHRPAPHQTPAGTPPEPARASALPPPSPARPAAAARRRSRRGGPPAEASANNSSVTWRW